jgi:hypothetical protein
MTSTPTHQVVPSAQGRTGTPQCRQPGPFPALVVRPATVTLPSYLRRHRRRQRAANQLAAALTDQCRAAVGPGHGLDGSVGVSLDDPRDYLLYVPGRQVVCDVIGQAPVLAAAPPPGAVRIGRDRRGRRVVAVLHAPVWSLVLRRAHPCPVVWAFLRASEHSFRFCGIGELGVAWDEMARHMYTTLTGDTA